MKIEHIYLLAGPEAGKRAAFVAELRAAVTAADGSPPEEHRAYTSETSVGELIALLQNGSLFSSRRLVEYRGAELIKGKEDSSALAAYIAAPSPDAILVLVSDAFYVEKAIEEAVGKERKKSFFEMFENEKPRWISNRLRQLGLDADDEAIEAILELVENESASLDVACLRLAASFPAGTVLTEDQVEAAIAKTRQEDAFSLFDRLVSDRFEAALDTLESVLADRKGDAVQIIAALGWSFRRLSRLYDLLSEGESFESACLRLQMRAKALQRQYQAALRRYTKADCERVVLLISRMDTKTRIMGAAYERILLQLLVYGIMKKKGQLSLSLASADLLF